MDWITWEEMKAIDANCEQLGLLPIQLMENAGSSIAREITNRFSGGKILLIAGRGNNGGDAFVAARHLCQYPQFQVDVILIGNAAFIHTEEAKRNFLLLKHCKVNSIKEITDSSDITLAEMIKNTDVIVDGILGTGVTGKIKELESSVIDLINLSGKYVISIDVPSGNFKTGREQTKCVKADLTITFHKMKEEFTTPEALMYTGEIIVSEIGVCSHAEIFAGIGNIRTLNIRTPDAHKGQAGKILIIGGGPYTGAPALAALAALRTGADIVTIACPCNVAATVAAFSPNLIVSSLSSQKLCLKDIPFIKDLIHQHDVIVMGMGLGNEKEVIETVRQIIPLCKKLVLDADALLALEEAETTDSEIIITPHTKEFARLRKRETSVNINERVEEVISFAQEKKLIVLLKGRIDIISDGKKVILNRTGNAGMSVGGTGDVLAGITGALLATNSPMKAATCAAYINGAAGDLAFKEKGYGLLATDIIEKITYVIRGEQK
ncbi:MAG: NAD(P)H-hydrate dehydratase [Methanomethylovorans sp.]|nr:NAD(P)H-hydrate dehydratase [Methanomethylovorans sp.]